MKKHFRSVAFCTAVLLILPLLAACSSSGITNAPVSSPSPASPAASPSSGSEPAGSAEAGGSETASAGIVDGPEMKLVLASYLNTGSPENIAMLHMADRFKERTGGRITADVHESGSIGTEMEIVEQIMTGSIHIGFTGTTAINKFATGIEPFAVPYLYSTTEQMKKSFEGRIGDEIKAKLLENGIYMDYIFFRGNRQLTSNKRIEKPEDLKGLKLRLPEVPTSMAVWGSLGTLSTPITSSEVFSALQTGVVDAQENSITSNYNKGLWEVQRYTVLTNHMVDFLTWIWGKKWFDGMSPEYQALFREILQEGADMATSLSLDGEKDKQKEMEEHGMEFIAVDSTLFTEAAAEAVAELAKSWPDWVYEQALADIEAAS